MTKNKLLLLLALLMTAATGAWAQDAKHLITATYDKQTRLLEQPLPYATTVGELYEAVTGQSFSDLMSTMSMLETPLSGIGSTNTDVVSIGGLNDASTPVTVNADGKATVAIRFGSYAQGIFVTVTPPLYVTMKDGVKDADKWTAKVGEGQAQALPIGGLKGDGSETVTLQYNGRMKVKGVKAVVEAPAPSVTEVTTFSELQTALSAGKNVKLMNDIVCTAEIEISSGALTIDGNGKKLSTTSEIRAFKVGSSATVAFKDLTLTGFVSGGGPAINNSGTIVLDGCTISNCHVNNSNGGGAIENKSNGKLYAINTTFSGNYSGEIGGAINNYRGSLYMSGCTFTNNYTTKSNAYWGGAIGINGGDEVRLINCSFSGNQYGTNAGPSDIGVYSNPTNYTIAGCTGATIASNNGDITTIASGTATLDYSDLSNISFTIEQSAKPAAAVTTVPTGAAVVGVGKSTALVSGGEAEGGTLWYAVTTTNTKPTSTAGFSDAVPTAKTITASGKVYVWYYVKGDDTHSDSEIAATAIEVPVADIVWDVTNVTDIDVAGHESYEKEGVRLSANAAELYAWWDNDGIIFSANESGGYTFTAPTGKAFTKIEMKAQGSDGWIDENLGSEWAYNTGTVTWTGSAASTVDLLTDTDEFEGATISYIAFTLVDAE